MNTWAVYWFQLGHFKKSELAMTGELNVWRRCWNAYSLNSITGVPFQWAGPSHLTGMAQCCGTCVCWAQSSTWNGHNSVEYLCLGLIGDIHCAYICICRDSSNMFWASPHQHNSIPVNHCLAIPMGWAQYFRLWKHITHTYVLCIYLSKMLWASPGVYIVFNALATLYRPPSCERWPHYLRACIQAVHSSTTR